MSGIVLDYLLIIPQLFYVVAIICLLSSFIQFMEINVAKHVRILHKHNGGWIIAILRLLMFSAIGYGLFGTYMVFDKHLMQFGFIFAAIVFGVSTLLAYLITVKKHPYI